MNTDQDPPPHSPLTNLLETFYTAQHPALQILYTLSILLLGGLCEIGGGYLIYQSLRSTHKSPYLAIPGGLILILYGVVMTFQMVGFARGYATYGGVFILMSLGWGWVVEGVRPDRWDWVGAVVALGGAAIIAFGPRG